MVQKKHWFALKLDVEIDNTMRKCIFKKCVSKPYCIFFLDFPMKTFIKRTLRAKKYRKKYHQLPIVGKNYIFTTYKSLLEVCWWHWISFPKNRLKVRTFVLFHEFFRTSQKQSTTINSNSKINVLCDFQKNLKI